MIRIEYKGRAIPQARVRYMRNGHIYTPPRTKEYREAFSAVAREQYTAEPLTEPLRVFILISMTPPESWSDRKKGKAFGKPIGKKPDVDNLAKAICDSLNGIVWHDDGQIAELFIVKSYQRANVVEVYIEEIAESVMEVEEDEQEIVVGEVSN